jgi:3',5'-cyclic AMP phosphodiesterase CpdA
MGFLIKKISIFLFILLVQYGCIGDGDLTGFLRSTDRIEDRYRSSAEWNKSHQFEKLILTVEDYNLLVAADIHIGDTTNFLKFLSHAIQPAITAMVLAGDIVSGKEKDYQTFFRLLPDDEIKPSFLLVGNHELYFDGWKHFYRMFGSSVYYFTIQTPTKEDLYICLDSGSGTLGKSQLSWLKKLLVSSRHNYDKCVILTHVNFFRDRHTLSTNPLTNELLVLMDLFEQYQVNYVIMGHDHISAVNTMGKTTYVTLDALVEDMPNPGFLKLMKKSSDLQHEFHSINED